jgi:hypothetical protein
MDEFPITRLPIKDSSHPVPIPAPFPNPEPVFTKTDEFQMIRQPIIEGGVKVDPW